MLQRHRQDDPLYRGDAKAAVRLPAPAAPADFVTHILALAGQDTPFLSTSESRDTADHFATGGAVWATTAARAVKRKVRHIGRTDLLAKLSRRAGPWKSQSQRVQAYAYVKRHAEHLFDFSGLADQAEPALRALIDDLFDRD